MKAWTKAWLWMSLNQVMWQWISHLSALLHLPSRTVVNKYTSTCLLAWGELVYSCYHSHRCAAIASEFCGESLFSLNLFPELPSCNNDETVYENNLSVNSWGMPLLRFVLLELCFSLPAVSRPAQCLSCLSSFGSTVQMHQTCLGS